MKREKKHYTVNLHIDSVNELKAQGMELCSYLRDMMDTNIETIEQKEAKLKELDKQMSILKTSIEAERKRKMEYIKKFDLSKNKDKIKDIKEAIEVIAKDKSFFEARRNRYNHIFGENFSSEEFQNLLNKYEEYQNGRNNL